MLTINSSAAYNSSRGVNRYFNNIFQYLKLWNDIKFNKYYQNKSIDKIYELIATTKKDSLLWSPAQRGPLFAKNHIVTVHDCINIEFIHTNGWKKNFLYFTSKQLLTNASIVIAISNSTKESIIKNYNIAPEKIEVIKSSSEVNLQDSSTSEINADSDRKIIHSPFILMVTNSLPHKNTLNACKALAKCEISKKKINLHVVGSLSDEAKKICMNSGINLTINNNVTDEKLKSLYKKCLFLFSPSLSEGHNLPIAEALSLKANVLCSEIPAHVEFYNGHVRFFDPKNINNITESILSAITEENSWNKKDLPTRSFYDVAKDYQNVFDRLSNK